MKPVDFTIYWEETPVVQVCYDENNKPQFTVLNPSHLPVLLFGMDGKAVPTARGWINSSLIGVSRQHGRMPKSCSPSPD